MSDKQVEAYLRKRYRWSWGKSKQATALVKKIPLLSARPMLLAYIPDLLESGKQIEHSFQLYEVMIEKWLERESRWVKPEDLRQFSERLAVDLHRNKERRGAERIPRAELTELAKIWNIPLDDWQLGGRSLLNRDAEGNYKFTHRSIMEYLFVKRLIESDVNCSGVALKDLMRSFLLEVVAHDQAMAQSLPLEVRWQLLRSKPVVGLNYEAVQAMLKLYDFFDSSDNSDNKEGNGVTHRFEPREYQGEKVMFDHVTGLMWQRSGSPIDLIYERTSKYLEKLNANRFAGFDDWRLPTLEEGMSLMERDAKNRAFFIAPEFDAIQRWVWTADKESQGRAWVVNFDAGGCDLNQAGSYGYVRAVR